MADTHETIADIIAEIRALSNTISDGIIAINGRSIADRIEAARKRELSKNTSKNKADFGQLGDAAKLREALESCLDTICRIVWIDDPVYDEDGHYLGANYAAVSRDKARAALAAPPRNCDVGTADDWLARFNVVCERCSGSDCDHRLFKDEEVCDCFARWLQMPYKEGRNDGNK